MFAIILAVIALVAAAYSLITSRGANILAWGVLALSIIHLIPLVK